MVRNLTDPDGDDTLEWQERVVDVDGDSVSIDLILDEVDDGGGFSNAADSNPSWLDFTPTTNTINTDETEVLVDITADTSGLSEGYKYKFEITADDGITTTTRTFQLEVTEPPDTTDLTTLSSTTVDVGSTNVDGDSETCFVINKNQDAGFIFEGPGDGTIVHEFTLGTAGDITTINVGGNTTFNAIGGDMDQVFGIHIDYDNQLIYANVFNGYNANSILAKYSYTDFTVANLTLDQAVEYVNLTGFANSKGYNGISVSKDGTKGIVAKEGLFEEVIFNTAYDITTAEAVNSITLSDNSEVLCLDSYNQRIVIPYAADSHWNTIDLGSPYDLSNTTINQDIGSISQTHLGIITQPGYFYTGDEFGAVLTKYEGDVV